MLIENKIIKRQDIIMATLETLIGPMTPVGEFYEDEERLKNAKLFMDVFSYMMAKILKVASYADDDRNSVSAIGKTVLKKAEGEFKHFLIGYEDMLGRNGAMLVPGACTLSMDEDSVKRAKETLAELEEWYEQWHGTHEGEENLNDVLYFAEKAVEYGGPILVK